MCVNNTGAQADSLIRELLLGFDIKIPYYSLYKQIKTDKRIVEIPLVLKDKDTLSTSNLRFYSYFNGKGITAFEPDSIFIELVPIRKNSSFIKLMRKRKRITWIDFEYSFKTSQNMHASFDSLISKIKNLGLAFRYDKFEMWDAVGKASTFDVYYKNELIISLVTTMTYYPNGYRLIITCGTPFKY